MSENVLPYGYNALTSNGEKSEQKHKKMTSGNTCQNGVVVRVIMVIMQTKIKILD